MAWLNKKKVQELAEQGMSSAAIARREDKSERAVQRTLKKVGLSKPQGRPPIALDSDFEAMYVKVNLVPKQTTRAQAAVELGCSLRTLDRRFKEIKRARRAKHETGRSKRSEP